MSLFRQLLQVALKAGSAAMLRALHCCCTAFWAQEGVYMPSVNCCGDLSTRFVSNVFPLCPICLSHVSPFLVWLFTFRNEPNHRSSRRSSSLRDGTEHVSRGGAQVHHCRWRDSGVRAGEPPVFGKGAICVALSFLRLWCTSTWYFTF